MKLELEPRPPGPPHRKNLWWWCAVLVEKPSHSKATGKKHIVASILGYTIELQRRALKEARSVGRGRAPVQTSIHASS